MERERIILADMPELSVTLFELVRKYGRITVAEAARSPMQAVTPLRIISGRSWIKGTSSCTVPAAAPGTVFHNEGVPGICHVVER